MKYNCLGCGREYDTVQSYLTCRTCGLDLDDAIRIQEDRLYGSGAPLFAPPVLSSDDERRLNELKKFFQEALDRSQKL
jgi:hypothetical protein